MAPVGITQVVPDQPCNREFASGCCVCLKLSYDTHALDPAVQTMNKELGRLLQSRDG